MTLEPLATCPGTRPASPSSEPRRHRLPDRRLTETRHVVHRTPDGRATPLSVSHGPDDAPHHGSLAGTVAAELLVPPQWAEPEEDDAPAPSQEDVS